MSKEGRVVNHVGGTYGFSIGAANEWMGKIGLDYMCTIVVGYLDDPFFLSLVL